MSSLLLIPGLLFVSRGKQAGEEGQEVNVGHGFGAGVGGDFHVFQDGVQNGVVIML